MATAVRTLNSSNVTQGGFRPLLFTVANGSYDSNATYGSGATELNNYQLFQLLRGTTTVPLTGTAYVTSTEGCDFRMIDHKVDFTCSIVLNSRLADPAFTDEELRIRPFYAGNSEISGQYSKPLPIPRGGLPLFEDVEITNKSGVQSAPDSGTAVGTYILQARLLEGGLLALVLKDISTVPPTVRGLQHNDIDGLFGIQDEIIRITVQGSYQAKSSSS